MVRIFALFLTLGFFVSAPSLAQDSTAPAKSAEAGVAAEAEAEIAAEPQTAIEAEAEEEGDIAPLTQEEGNYERRLELSRQMHDIWPIRQKVENALDLMEERIEPTRRIEFKSAMRKAIEFDALEEASIDAMADVFTVKELEAMIEFYGSKEGKAVSAKLTDYEKAMEPILAKMVDRALLDLRLGSQ